MEPELLKQVEVNKGPHDVKFGNGGFGGVVKMETKDAIDLLDPDKYVGGLLKYSFHSNNHQNMETGAVYGRTKNNFFDGLVYYTKRNSGNFKRPDGSRFVFSEDDMDTYMGKWNIRLNEKYTKALIKKGFVLYVLLFVKIIFNKIEFTSYINHILKLLLCWLVRFFDPCLNYRVIFKRWVRCVGI